MNQTQRKFVSSRIFDNLIGKISVIREEDTKIKTKLAKLKHMSGVQEYDAIKSGLAVLKPKSKINFNCWQANEVQTVYDFSKVNKKEIKAHIKEYGVLKERELVLTNTLTGKTFAARVSAPSSISRILKMQPRLDAIVNELMLGDAEEAKALILAVEQETF